MPQYRDNDIFGDESPKAAVRDTEIFGGETQTTEPVGRDPFSYSPSEIKVMQQQFLRNEGTVGSRIRNTPAKEIVKNIAMEPVRIGNEIVTVPASLLKKSAFGLAALGKTAAGMANGQGIDAALQSGAKIMEDYRPFQGVADPSMIGETIGGAANYVADTAENATGNTGFARAGIEAGMDIAGLLGAAKMVGTVAKPALNSFARTINDFTIKQPTTLKPEIRRQNSELSLEQGFIPTRKGFDKLNTAIKDKEQYIQGRVNTEGSGIYGTFDRSIQNIEGLRDLANRSSDPVANNALIDAELARINQSPMVNVQGAIEIPEMQKMKMEQGREITQKYQTREGQAPDQFQSKIDKARVRGLKEEVEFKMGGVFPELADENGQLSAMYKLRPVIDRAVSRIENNQGIGIGLPIKTGSGAAFGGFVGGPTGATIGGAIGATIGIIEHPAVAPRLAKALYVSQKGKITPSQARKITLQRINDMKQNLMQGAAGEMNQQNNDPLGIRQ